jgi:superfamily II DNA helicase RecQ
MAHRGQYVVIDEAHLMSDWSDFCKAYIGMKGLKYTFPDVPLMALTATATHEVENDLRNPLTVKASIICSESQRW